MMFAGFIAGNAGAQSETAAFAADFERFRAAIRANDAEAAADLTALPFLFDGRPRDRAGFLAEVYPALFDDEVRGCVAEAEPAQEESHFVVYCGTYIFYFGMTAGGYRLQDFVADPEASE
jgi:hypothetical protein